MNKAEAFRKACPGFAKSIENWLESDNEATEYNLQALAYRRAFYEGFEAATEMFVEIPTQPASSERNARIEAAKKFKERTGALSSAGTLADFALEQINARLNTKFITGPIYYRLSHQRNAVDESCTTADDWKGSIGENMGLPPDLKRPDPVADERKVCECGSTEWYSYIDGQKFCGKCGLDRPSQDAPKAATEDVK